MNKNNWTYALRLGFVKRYLLLLCISFFGLSLQAQISHGGVPASFQYEQADDTETAYAPAIPYSLTKNEAITKQCTAYKFGEILPFGKKRSEFGTEKIDSRGNSIWKATITSEGALALGLYFTDFYLPKGAKLFIYSPDKEQIIGSFTENNNSESGLFATELILGDKLIIEYNEPASVRGKGRFTLNEVLHAYRGVSDLKSSMDFGDSGSCEVNVNCSEGADYNNQKNSVVRLLIKEGNSAFWCTGSVINNVNNNLTPFILTADHCGSEATTTDLNQWVFYFNYQSNDCSNPLIAPTPNTMTGCTKLAASSNAGILGSDFYLVLLKQNIPTEYNPYFMGWDRSGLGSTNGVSIHHPQGDIKKISTYTTALSSATYTSNGYNGLTNGSWEVVWSETLNGHGVTEGGSSGCPIYSQDGFLIGTLTGGWAACSNLSGKDYYGKFNYHWDKNGDTPDTQLKPWLDPNNTGATQISGFPLSTESIPISPADFYTLFPNPSNGDIKIQFNADAFGKSYTIRVSNMLGQSVYQENKTIYKQVNLNLQHLQSGVYFVEIEGNTQRQTQKISIQ
ncbi:MAG: T9SS type A sorting domain-containing protein [Bacteroidales bacterium]|nr:T9SS type A sorting domain-containing protein [Bacteroidales bacterium]